VRVAVVGGGPAGAWTAYRLARAGAQVTIFDGSHPREKPCGGGVTGRALSIVQDAVDLTALAPARIRRARFTSDTSDSIVELEAGALAVSGRAAFDAALLEAAQRAGVRLSAARVVDVAATRSAWRLTTGSGDGQRHTFDFVIGADGANSLVRRRLASPFRRDQLSIATGFFASGVSSDEIVIEMTADPPGYAWSFPRPDHLAIGICAQADAAASGPLRARAAGWIARAGIARGAALTPYSWPIPSLMAADLRTQVIAGPRWCLVGDAAGLVDPITREGIFFALASADCAADALLRDGASAAPAYARRVNDGIVDELARAARVKDLFFRPAFAGLLVRALRDSAAVRAVMADLIAGTQSYRSLKRRLLKTFEIGLAWRALRTAMSRP
jgi:geranylgeranyl reductase family protein